MAAISKLFIVLLLGIILLPGLGRAEKETRYIGDTLIVAMRNGPGSTFSIVKTLRTGNSVIVLGEKDDYLQVRANDNSEGWIKKQYTIDNPPSSILLPKLRKKNNQLILSKKHYMKEITELKNKLSQNDDDFKSKHQEILAQDAVVQGKLETLEQDLEQKTSQYNELLNQSKQFISVRDERDTLKKNNSILQNRVNSLEDENNRMANKKMIYWFLTGGGVFFIGWLIGKTTYRSKRSTLSL